MEMDCILDKREIFLWNRTIQQVKVQWKHLSPDETTREFVEYPIDLHAIKLSISLQNKNFRNLFTNYKHLYCIHKPSCKQRNNPTQQNNTKETTIFTWFTSSTRLHPPTYASFFISLICQRFTILQYPSRKLFTQYFITHKRLTSRPTN